MAKKAVNTMQAQMLKQEKQWRAESDARLLMDAAKLAQDSARLKAAQAEANKIAKAATQAAGGKTNRSR